MQLIGRGYWFSKKTCRNLCHWASHFVRTEHLKQVGKATSFIWLVLGVTETQTLLKNKAIQEVLKWARVQCWASASATRRNISREILLFFGPWCPTQGYYLVVLRAVTCVIGKAVKPGKCLPWSHGCELCLALAEHEVGLDMDSEKPWVTLHCSLGSN